MNDENSTDPVDLDIFGLPQLPIKDRRGRPSFGKSKENQDVVCVLRAAGWSQKRIATYLCCDEKTLRKNFSRELEHGLDMIEGQALEVVLRKMRQGDLKAANRMFDIIEKKGNPAVPMPKAAKEEPLGKKETADRDAQTAHEGTEWGTLLQ